jgi:hypothetical protein
MQEKAGRKLMLLAAALAAGVVLRPLYDGSIGHPGLCFY